MRPAAANRAAPDVAHPAAVFDITAGLPARAMPVDVSLGAPPSSDPDALAAAPDRRGWDDAVRPLVDAAAGRLWRAHSDALNAALLDRWIARTSAARALKTDLFDEAMGVGLVPAMAERARDVVAIDIAPSVMAAAAQRYPSLGIVAADVRHLPFADAAFDLVVSNSTLDHFRTRAEIAASLSGLARVLAPGGRLVLTMDNQRHPAVALRNALPAEWLRRVGLVSYPLGVTVGPRGLARLLRHAGFEILDTVALLHCPRALAVRRARAIERRKGAVAHRRFLDRLGRWEWLAGWPTRFLTGHYVGMLARKP